MPPLDRLSVRQVSPRFLSQDERIEIADLVLTGVSIHSIAERLGRAPSTISRELRRNASSGRAGYRPFEAAPARDSPPGAASSSAPRHPRGTAAVGERAPGAAVEPQQISRHLRRRFPHEPSMRLCHESVYQALYQPGSVLLRPSSLAPERRSPLRTGRDHRRALQKVDRRRPRFEQPMLSIHQRPFVPADRSQTGHWEGDLIIGKAQGSAIGTLVERQTRMVRLLHLPQRDGESLHAALRARLGDLPEAFLRSITWDQGTEMAGHRSIARSLGVHVYFCDSRSPWQRGSNENMNGLLRDYFPKGSDLRVRSPRHLTAVENGLNHRPRMVLNDRAPIELFQALLASEA